MKRNLFWLAIAGAGAYFLSTDEGRRWTRRAGESLREGYQQFYDTFARRGGVENIVREQLEHEAPDTPMASAFREAVSEAHS